MAEIVPSVKNSREGTHREFWKIINEEKDKNMNSGLLPSKRDQNVQGRKKKRTVGWTL